MPFRYAHVTTKSVACGILRFTEMDRSTDRSMLVSLRRHHTERERMICGSRCVALIKGD
jgi:hypothetical protein